MMKSRSSSAYPRNRRIMMLAAALAASVLWLAPGAVSAQTIGGTVADETGGVLPGVTVEARSPALIEQVRTAVTDGNGQYRIVALEPGAYSVTFSLAGFSTLVREGIELATGFAANVDAELAVGQLAETITVTEATPIIDVQSIEQTAAIDRDIFESLPTARQYDSLALLIPAMNIAGGSTTSLSADTAGISGEGRNRMSIHGSNQNDAEVQFDGMDISSPSFDGAPHFTPFDTGIAEFVYDYSGNSAEVETGGVRLNMIPKEGSNTFSGSLRLDGTHSAWLANNVGPELLDRGITGGAEGGVKLDQAWTIAPAVGGPIARDRLWFFATYSFRRGSIYPANYFANTDTSALRYVPDVNRPLFSRKDISEGSLRLTWQATSKDKVQVYASLPGNRRHILPALSGSDLDPQYIAPEAGSENEAWVNTYQLTWVRPQTNRILFEFGVGLQPVSNRFPDLSTEVQRMRGTGREDIGARPDLPSVYEATTQTMSRNMGFFFQGTDFHIATTNNNVRASMSYVTGSHNLKIGTQVNQKFEHYAYGSKNDWTNMITVGGNPIQARFHARPAREANLTNVGVYAQEQWTIDRLTVNAGLRFDYFKGFYPDQTAPAMTWAPQERFFPGATVAGWKDLQPRLGVVYDLRGDGRTALKASASRYGEHRDLALVNTLNPIGKNTTMPRSWYDGGNPFRIPGLPSCIGPVECIAGDGLVQGDPLNPRPNGEIISPDNTPGFASTEPTVFLDPDWAFGWGKKSGNWEYSGSIQHELTGGVSIDIGYFRRHYFNYSVVDDRAIDPEDWDRYTITVPQDQRLPNGGGYDVTLIDLNPSAVAVPDEITTHANSFGGRLRRWHGFDFNFNANFESVLLQGGYAVGKEVNDFCGMQAALPEIVNAAAGTGQSVVPLEHCDSQTPWISQGSVFGSYTFPYDIQVSGTFFSRQGTPRQGIIAVPLPVAAAALGRTPTETSITVNVVEPGQSYGDRLNQLDMRVGKIVNVGGTGANIGSFLEIYNVFNGNAVSRERYGLAASYLRPIGLQAGRLFKVAFQLNF